MQLQTRNPANQLYAVVFTGTSNLASAIENRARDPHLFCPTDYHHTKIVQGIGC